jgi:hypothetical protein
MVGKMCHRKFIKGSSSGEAETEKERMQILMTSQFFSSLTLAKANLNPNETNELEKRIAIILGSNLQCLYKQHDKK